MDFDLSDDHRAIQRPVRDFAASEVAPVAEELDKTKSFPYEIVRQLGELNLMGIPFPEEYGGGGGDTLAYALAVEELTRVDSSVAITLCAHTSLGTQPIWLFGTEEQKREWMPRLCSGEQLGAFGLTEPEAGSDAGNTKTTARLDRRRVGRSTAPSSSSPTRGPTSPASCASPRRPATSEISNLLVANGHARLRAGRAVPQDGLERVRHAAAVVRPTAGCRRPTCSARGGRASGSSCTSSTSGASASRRWASGSRRARSTRRSPTPRSAARSASRSRSSRRSRPSSPT